MSRKPCLRSERVRDDKHKAVICQMCGRLIGSPVCLWQFLNPCESIEAALQQAADG
jgi:hypothetical protein